MFSDTAVKTFEGCRFCPMCRHLCPIGLKTGSENNTPRAKALLSNFINRGIPYSADMASDMYECCLCYACATDCESGYEPPLYIREARTLAVVEGLVPPAVQQCIDNLGKTGNIFGLPAADKFAGLQAELDGLPDKAEILVYIGATAAYKTPAIAKAFLHLLKKAKVPFTVLGNEPQSGAEMGDLIGFVDDVRTVAKQCAAAITATGAKTLIVLDPVSARMFKQQYGEWNIELPQVVTATAYVASLVTDKKLRPRSVDLAATYQDDSTLTRELDETEAPREIIAGLGVTLKEMFLNRKRVKNGGTVLVNEYAPRLTTLTGQGRWKDALRAKVPVLLTATPDTYYVMEKTTPPEMRLQDIFVLLDENC